MHSSPTCQLAGVNPAQIEVGEREGKGLVPGERVASNGPQQLQQVDAAEEIESLLFSMSPSYHMYQSRPTCSSNTTPLPCLSRTTLLVNVRDTWLTVTCEMDVRASAASWSSTDLPQHQIRGFKHATSTAARQVQASQSSPQFPPPLSLHHTTWHPFVHSPSLRRPNMRHLSARHSCSTSARSRAHSAPNRRCTPPRCTSNCSR